VRGHRQLRIASATLVMAAMAACQTGAPSRTPVPAAGSFEEYAASFCSAFEAMFRAVGNPDTGSGSDLSKALDAAVAAGDVASADKLAAAITSELESGRRHVAFARGWPPAEPMMAQLDRVFVAFEAWVEAKRAAAGQAPNAVDPQAAFERAGGVEAWLAMFQAGRAVASARPAGEHRCASVPIGT